MLSGLLIGCDTPHQGVFDMRNIWFVDLYKSRVSLFLHEFTVGRALYEENWELE